MQVTGAVVTALNLPSSLNAIIVWMGVATFPFVVVFSWLYELTPEGIKRESEVDRSASITPQTGRKLDYLIVGLLVAAIAIALLDRFVPRDQNAAGAGSSSSPRDSSAAQEDNRAQGALPQQQATTATSAPDDKSVAVLPFVNMSSDKEQE